MAEYSGRLTEALVLARTRATELDNVRKLNCWGSDIADVSIVRKIPNLEVCSLRMHCSYHKDVAPGSRPYLSVNSIPTLEDFSFCHNLQELYIRKNIIQELYQICHLKNLPRLRILWLADNPCAKGENYRLTVLKHLPNLQKLDNIVVAEDEINRAVEEGDDLKLPEKELEIELENGQPRKEHQIVPPKDNKTEMKDNVLQDVVTLTLDETNKIREQLGLKPLPAEKMTPPKSLATGATKSRNSHILQAVMLLIRELDTESLEIVGNAVKNRLDSS